MQLQPGARAVTPRPGAAIIFSKPAIARRGNVGLSEEILT